MANISMAHVDPSTLRIHLWFFCINLGVTFFVGIKVDVYIILRAGGYLTLQGAPCPAEGRKEYGISVSALLLL